MALDWVIHAKLNLSLLLKRYNKHWITAPNRSLDFSKAFDTVSHQRLLKKLQFYGIKGNILNWIKTWLTQKSIINGDHSKFLHVESSVPQGTVLDPIMFLLYINDIGEISSSIRLFVDDFSKLTLILLSG